MVNTSAEIKYGPEGEEIVGGWRRLHNEELQHFTECW